MTIDVSPQLGEELSRVVKSGDLIEGSRNRKADIMNAEPLSTNRKRMLAESIVNGEITFRDALSVVRGLDMLAYFSPESDRVGTNPIDDRMRLFVLNDGNAILNTYRPSDENHYIINDGVLSPVLRLPHVIEGVRQVLLILEGSSYGNHPEDSQRKKEKIERLSQHLYELTDFQTDLIADELIMANHPEWKQERKKILMGKEGDRNLVKAWEQQRREVVRWMVIEEEMREAVVRNGRLSSLIERPVIREDLGKVERDVSPIDPLFNREEVKAQVED